MIIVLSKQHFGACLQKALLTSTSCACLFDYVIFVGCYWVVVFQSLYEGLSEVDQDLWGDIIQLQRHWIGECDGTRLKFSVKVRYHPVLETLDRGV